MSNAQSPKPLTAARLVRNLMNRVHRLTDLVAERSSTSCKKFIHQPEINIRSWLIIGSALILY